MSANKTLADIIRLISSQRDHGFTLIELLVVIGILAILATAVIIVLNPAQMMAQARDATRLSDIETITKALQIYQSSGATESSMGSYNTIYISVPDTDPQCGNLNLPATTSPWNYHCVTAANLRNADGTGWIPINLFSVSYGSPLDHLPVDPINATSTGLYYTYIHGSFAVSAAMESIKYQNSSAIFDGGYSSIRYEKGSDLSLDANLSFTDRGIIVPTIAAVNPTSGYNNNSVSLSSITGTGFQQGAIVKLTKSGQSDIICSGITVVSATSITGGSCSIISASSGSWNIVVTNADTGFGAGANLFTVNQSSITTNYWQNGGVDHNWSTAGNWSLGHKPAAGEDVAMGAIGWDATVNEATANLNSFDMTGYANTLSGSNAITVVGTAGATANVKFSGIVSWTGTLNLNPPATANIYLVTNGKQLGPVTITGTTSGAVYLIDNLNIGSNTLTFYSGTLHTDGLADNYGLTHTWSLFTSPGTNTRTLTLGNSTINVTGAGTGWNIGDASGLTENCGTSVINLTGDSTRFINNSNHTVGQTYYTVNFTGTGAAQLIFGTFTNLTYAPTVWANNNSLTIQQSGSSYIIVTGTLTINGNSEANRALFSSANGAGSANVINVTGATVSVNNVDFRDVTFVRTNAGGLDLTVGGTHIAGDAGGNSRTGGDNTVTFSQSASQNFINVAGGSWSIAANWSGGRVPLPQDDVTFATAFNSGVTITADLPRLGRSVDFSGATATGAGVLPKLSLSNNITTYGGITLGSDATHGLKVSGGIVNNYYWYNESQTRTGTNYITSAGRSFTYGPMFQAVGATASLADDIVSSYYINILYGGFNSAGHTITANGLFSSGTGTRTVNITNSTINVNYTTSGFISFTNTGITLISAGSTINVNYAGSANDDFVTGGGLTFNNLSVSSSGTYLLRFRDSVTFTGTVTIAGPRTVLFYSGITLNAANWVVSGSAGNIVTLGTVSGVTVPPILNKTGGGTVLADYLSVQNVNVTPTNTWYYGTHSTYGLALNFGGQASSGDYVSAANSAVANQWKNSTAFSVEAWAVARGTGGSAYGRLIDKYGAVGYRLYNDNGNWEFDGIFSDGTKTSNTKAVVNNSLAHVVGVWDGSNLYVYLNGSGSTAKTAAGTSLDDSSLALDIGNVSAYTSTFDGTIYAVRIYRNIALSAANVTTLYNAGIKANNPLGNATSQYLFNDGTGATLTDDVGGINGTISGAKWANTGWNVGP